MWSALTGLSALAGKLTMASSNQGSLSLLISLALKQRNLYTREDALSLVQLSLNSKLSC